MGPKCGQCKEGRLLERYWPWKPKVALVMKCTLLLWPLALAGGARGGVAKLAGLVDGLRGRRADARAVARWLDG